MSVSTVISILVPAIAKALLKAHTGEGLGGEIADAAVDKVQQFIEQRQGRRITDRRVSQIAEQISDRMWQILGSEVTNITLQERQVIAAEVSYTLVQANVSTDMFVDCRLNPERVAKRLEHVRPDATSLLSTDQAALYRQMLVAVGRELITIVTELSDFSRSTTVRILQDQAQLLELIERLITAPDSRAERFTDTYRHQVSQTLDRVELFGIPRWDEVSKRQRVSVTYISLQAETRIVNQSDDQLWTRDVPADSSSVQSERNVVGGSEPRNTSIEQILARSRRIIVTGEAGAGKSTLLQWLAVRSAKSDFRETLINWNRSIPFYIRLRERVDQGFPVPEDFPKTVAKQVAGDMPLGWVHDQLFTGRAVVFVDGIDELPYAQRASMLEELARLVSSYPLARYVITSRPVALREWPEWDEWIRESDFDVVSLRPMSFEQIEDFIRQWHTALTERAANDELEEISSLPASLLRLLRGRPPLLRLATNPLLCAMICVLHREMRTNLPSERLVLYQECIAMLLSRRDVGRGIKLDRAYSDLTISKVGALIESLAAWMMRNGWSDVATDQADEFLNYRLEYMDVPQGVDGQSVRRLLVERSGLLSEPVADRVAFVHRTFQEYLAAKALVEESGIGELIMRADDDQWRELIILAAGMARPKESERLLRQLIDPGISTSPWLLAATHAQRYVERRRVLALACLETCIELAPDIRRQVIDSVAQLFPPYDSEQSRIVAVGGDLAVPFLQYNPQYPLGILRLCIESLTNIGSVAAMEALASYATDERWEIVSDIGDAWLLLDRREYARLVLAHSKKLYIRKISDRDYFDLLTHLRELLIGEISGLKTIHSILQLKDLETLYLLSPRVYDNTSELNMKIESIDISSIINLSKLKNLGLQGIRFRDLRPIARLTQLERLYLDDTPLDDLSIITDLNNLRSLYISNTQVSDINQIGKLSGLTELSLRGLQLTDLTPLEKLTNLELLDISGNLSHSLVMLVHLHNLRIAILDDLQIDNFTVLAEFQNMQRLSLCNTSIRETAPLQKLTNLTYLNLANTEVNDLSPLAELTNLTHLNISNTKVIDLRPLAAMHKLSELVIEGTRVRDLNPLASLINLRHLHIDPFNQPDISPLRELIRNGLNIRQMALALVPDSV